MDSSSFNMMNKLIADIGFQPEDVTFVIPDKITSTEVSAVGYEWKDLKNSESLLNEFVSCVNKFGLGILNKKDNTILLSDTSKFDNFIEKQGQLKLNLKLAKSTSNGKTQISSKVTEIFFNQSQIKKLDESKLALILNIFINILNEFNKEKADFKVKYEGRPLSQIHIVQVISNKSEINKEVKQEIKQIINAVFQTFSQFEKDSFHEKEAAEEKKRLQDDDRRDDIKKQKINNENRKITILNK